MTIMRKVLTLGLVGAMSVATFGVASARPAHAGARTAKVYRGHARHYARGPGAGGLVAGAALGLLGAGIAGAAASSNYGYGGYGYAPGYGYGAPAYGYAPGYGYGAPRYGYYGGY